MKDVLRNNFYIHTVPPSGLKLQGSSNTPVRLGTVTIECNVTANPSANIVWMKQTDNETHTLVNTSRISIAHQVASTTSGPVTGSILTINSVESADNGVYICEASNELQSPPASTNFTICVIGICTHVADV